LPSNSYDARLMTTRRRVIATGWIIAAGLAATACGSEGISLKSGSSQQVQHGADLFSERCAGCHTLDVAGTQGSATRVHDRERTDGPNFNVRPETSDSVLYAVRNGGFSGAIMPQNIVVGKDAEAVAAFVSKYAGSKRAPTISPPSQPVAGAGGGGQGGGSGAPSTGTTSTPAQQGTSSTPAQGTTSTPEAGTTSTPAAGTTSTGAGTQQAAAQGKQIFTQQCGACHTLKDAGTKGQVGPNLDDLKPDLQTTQTQVTNGGGGMPPFKGTLTKKQISDVSTYVVHDITHGKTK
jgi:mono/diheme cytochrome c family protein